MSSTGEEARHPECRALSPCDDPLILLPAEAFDELVAWLDEPPEPNPALERLLRQAPDWDD